MRTYRMYLVAVLKQKNILLVTNPLKKKYSHRKEFERKMLIISNVRLVFFKTVNIAFHFFFKMAFC